ncbi:hypothetical protein EV183_005611 [Coemansia sp. RSA 2336]|nr:hypothetical protein EV183_005611 [Coemansia sp. RSA 2336]
MERPLDDEGMPMSVEEELPSSGRLELWMDILHQAGAARTRSDSRSTRGASRRSREPEVRPDPVFISSSDAEGPVEAPMEVEVQTNTTQTHYVLPMTDGLNHEQVAEWLMGRCRMEISLPELVAISPAAEKMAKRMLTHRRVELEVPPVGLSNAVLVETSSIKGVNWRLALAMTLDDEDQPENDEVEVRQEPPEPTPSVASH